MSWDTAEKRTPAKPSLLSFTQSTYRLPPAGNSWDRLITDMTYADAFLDQPAARKASRFGAAGGGAAALAKESGTEGEGRGVDGMMKTISKLNVSWALFVRGACCCLTFSATSRKISEDLAFLSPFPSLFHFLILCPDLLLLLLSTSPSSRPSLVSRLSPPLPLHSSLPVSIRVLFPPFQTLLRGLVLPSLIFSFFSASLLTFFFPLLLSSSSSPEYH